MAARDDTPRPIDSANRLRSARRRAGTLGAVVLAGIALLSSLAAGAAQAAPADSWTIQDTTGSAGGFGALAYGDETFVAASCDSGLGNKFLVSTDSAHWTRAGSDIDGCYAAVAHGEGRFVAASMYDHKVTTSADGLTWTSQCPGTGDCNDGGEWSSITYGGGTFVAVSFFPGDRVLVSDDGVNFAIQTITPDATNIQWRDVSYGNGRFVAVSHFGKAMYSTDGLNWTVSDTAVGGPLYVTYGNGAFVALNGAATTGSNAQTSADGVTWTAASGVPGRSWSDLTFGEGTFVAVGAAGTGDRAMTSTDGLTWTLRPTPVDNGWWGLTYGDGVFVAIAGTGSSSQRVMTSGTFAPPAATTTSTSTTSTSTTSTSTPTTTMPVSTTTTAPTTSTTTVPVSTPPPGSAGAAAPDVSELTALPSGLVAPASVRPGQAITLEGEGFLPGERVSIVMRSTPTTLGEVIAGADGRATAEVTIPDAAAVGDHHLYMLGLTSRTGVQAATQVGTAPRLAVTGAPVITQVVLAALFLVIGGWFVRLGEGAPREDRQQD